MRAAPAVDAALAAGELERMLITVLHALAGALVAVWLALHTELPPDGAALAAVLGAAGLMAALGHRLAKHTLPPQPGRLRWDGQCWSAMTTQVLPLQRLVVAVDLGLWVLLQLHPADGGRVLWRIASARSDPTSWHGLRVALAAHAGAAAPHQDEAKP